MPINIIEAKLEKKVIETIKKKVTMSSLPGNFEFAKAEEEICAKWKEESTFKTQNRLSEERGDEVRLRVWYKYS